jgi:hypothetical protein
VLAGVIEINDPNGTGKMQIRLIPYPFGSVPQYHLLRPTCPAPMPGFGIQPATEFLAALDCAHIAGGSFIPYGIAFFIDFGLREYTAKLGFPRVRRLAVISII